MATATRAERRPDPFRLAIAAAVLFFLLPALGSFVFIFFIRTGSGIFLLLGLTAILGVILLALLWTGLLPRQAAPAASPEVRVRCRACRELNPEDARFCTACGKPL